MQIYNTPENGALANKLRNKMIHYRASYHGSVASLQLYIVQCAIGVSLKPLKQSLIFCLAGCVIDL